jgi:hypothetical protein
MKPKHAALTATIAVALFISWILGAMIAPQNISLYIIFIPVILFVVIWIWCDIYKSLRKIDDEQSTESDNDKNVTDIN